MAGVNAVGDSSGYSYNEPINPQAPTQGLTSTDFLKLLAAQLRYQDMSSPMSNSEMMDQLTQMSSIQSMASMVTSVNSLASLNVTTYATSMIGKEVTIALLDKDGKFTKENLTGTISGVSLYNNVPMICINDKNYYASQIMSVGKVEPPPVDEGDKDEGDKGDGDSDVEKPEPTK